MVKPRVIGSGPYVRLTLRQKGIETEDSRDYRYIDLDGRIDDIEASFMEWLQSGAFRRRKVSRPARIRRFKRG